MTRRHLSAVPDQPAAGPYGLAAKQYHELGWAPIPLPARKKMPPPTGWTGGSRTHSGEMPSAEKVDQWVESEANGNVAIRLMDGYIAIDVDAYDEKDGKATLAKAEKALGKLPRTVMSSSRDDSSGCRIYRVPPGLKWPGNFSRLFGDGVDICRWDLRFVVAAPSIHPSSGERYQWRDSDTFQVILDEDGDPIVPALNEVADLPEAWVEHFTKKQPWVGFTSVDLGDDEASQWLDERNNEEVCSALDAVLTRWQGKVMGAGNIHDDARDGAWAILREAAKGHSGVKAVLARLKKTYAVAMQQREPSRAGGADAEWKRFVFQGINKIAGENETGERDACDTSAVTVARAVGSEGGKIVLGNTPESIRELGRGLREGAIPGTYARRGELVRLRFTMGDDDELHLIVDPLSVDSLREELAQHAKVVSPKFDKEGELESYADKSPPVEVLKSVLTSRNWKPLPNLRGLVKQPIFRPDGSLLQTPGYDSATGFYYEPEREFPPVGARPDPLTVASARLWLLDTFLRDFPWVEPPDFANYLALLVTPMIRPILGADVLSPFGVVSATAAGSGKSLLAEEIISRLYRVTSYPWTRREEERQKAITTAFAADSQIVVFDNVGDNDRIDSPSLAKLLTSRNWDDRRMGKNTEVLSYLNNRLWMATGNNISLGGDIQSRTVLVRLDPLGASPQFRTGFALGDLNTWLTHDVNVNQLLRALLILVLDWVAAGSPREEYVMRGFTAWASGLGGFLKHHSISGFLGNAAALREADSEEEEWSSFLADLRGRKGMTTGLTAAEIHGLYVDGFGGDQAGQIPLPARGDGSTPNVRGLGMMLQKRIGRFFGGLTIDGSKINNTRVWRVLTQEERVAARKEGTTPG